MSGRTHKSIRFFDLLCDVELMRSTSGVEFKVLAVLCGHCDDDGICWPGRELIADHLGITDLRTVTKLTTALEQKGLIERVAVGRRNGGVTGWLVFPQPVDRVGKSPTLTDPQGGQNGAFRVGKTARSRKKAVSGEDHLFEDHTYARALDPARGFDEFWAAYPARRGRKLGKAKTLTHWSKLSDGQRQAAMVGVAHYAAECNGYAKDPERWVRDRLWEDYQEPAKPFTNGHRTNGHGKMDAEATLIRVLEKYN